MAPEREPVCGAVWVTWQLGLLKAAGIAWQALLLKVQEPPDMVVCRTVAVEQHCKLAHLYLHHVPGRVRRLVLHQKPCRRMLLCNMVAADAQPTCQAG